MKEVRVGIIGVGNIGGAHANCISGGNIPGMRLTALCDIDPEKQTLLRRQYPGVPVFDNAEALLGSGLTDAVIIATPHYFHPPLAITAFEKGQHVLTEKPAGVSVGAVMKMNEQARKSGKVFAIMFNQRTDPLFRKAREIVTSGALGVPKRLIWIVTNWYRTQAYYDSGSWRATWNGEGGGVLLNQAPHNLDLWQWIFGMPKRIFASCPRGKYHHIAVEDEATLYAEYENGATATFITTTGETPGTNRLEITGDRGKLVLENGSLTWWKLNGPERSFCFESQSGFYEPEMAVETFSATPVDGHPLILANFADAILSGAELIAPGCEGIHELSISNAAYLSAWTDSWAELPVDTALFESYLEKLRRAETVSAKQRPENGMGSQYDERWQVRW